MEAISRVQPLSSTIRSLQRRALSDDWHEREEAGFALRNLLEERFVEGWDLTESWVTHPSARVRRAVCLACMQRKNRIEPSKVQRLLKRLAKLMEDDDIYVRKCCGPFVVGYLGYTYPSLMLPWLQQQASRHDLNVRANVAKAFSQALGGQYPHEGLSILTMLASDSRHRVRSAVVASLRNILRRGGTTPQELEQRFPELFQRVVGPRNG